MPFSIGDILLKIDMRATSETIYTMHHVMLVLGESSRGYPIVAHMIAAPNWKLMKEELTRGKDLKLIHHSWPEVTQLAIAKTAEAALHSDKFVINPEIIQQHSRAVCPFRPVCSLDAKRKLEMLYEAFDLESTKTSTFIPTPETQTIMSCHQWVMSVIHYACHQTKTPIPKTLQISPHLAWADRINYSAETHKLASCTLKSIPFYSSSAAPVGKPKVPALEIAPKAVPKEPIQKDSILSSMHSFFSFVETAPKRGPSPGILLSNKF